MKHEDLDLVDFARFVSKLPAEQINSYSKEELMNLYNGFDERANDIAQGIANICFTPVPRDPSAYFLRL